MAMTKKKQSFADAILRGANQTQAALEAGCPASSAAQSGSRYAKDPDIIAYIQKKENVKSDVKGVVKSKKAKKEVDLPPSKLTMADVERVMKNYVDPLDYLMDVINSDVAEVDDKLKVDCAKAALPYFHGKVATKGKKEAAKEKAEALSARGGLSARLASKRMQ
ncbi:MAG: terminase small subunit [Neisseriaceae bacterium]|nr:terminase small subunit [Neisseriaceae bacterium]